MKNPRGESNKMKTLSTIANGYSCSLGLSQSGWFAGVLVLANTDQEFVDGYESIQGGLPTAVLHPGKNYSDWKNRIMYRKPEVYLSAEGRCDLLGQAELISGVSAVSGDTGPVLIWIERSFKEWRLMCYRRGSLLPLEVRHSVIKNPQAVLHQGRFVYCFEYLDAGCERIAVYDKDGSLLTDLAGRSPALVSGCDLMLAYEESRGPNDVRIKIRVIVMEKNDTNDENADGGEYLIPALLDQNFNPRPVYDSEHERVYLVHEAAPAWGENWFFSIYRELGLWCLEKGAENFLPAAHCPQGRLPLPPTFDMNDTNNNWPHVSWYGILGSEFDCIKQHAPIMPRPFLLDGSLAVAYRRFAVDGGHTWKTVYTVLGEDGWSPGREIGDFYHEADTDYSVLTDDGLLYAAWQTCSVPMVHERREATLRAGLSASSWQCLEPAWDYRAVVITEAIPESLEFRSEKETELVSRPNTRRRHPLDLCPPPPELAGDSLTPQLLWGDMHAHTNYSVCSAATDGTMLDVMRFQRDILGCQVLCITDHGGRESLPSQLFSYDILELEAADRCIPLFGVEPSTFPAHNINFYCVNRRIFNALRTCYYSNRDERDIFQQIKEEFPAGSVIAIRHFHGKDDGSYGVRSAKTVGLYDAELEPAMEAMQIRGNRMVTDDDQGPIFPNNFLDAGARIGLVGGTDHAIKWEPHSFCLTGFWVDEASPRGVFKALKSRKTFACSNGKLALHTDCTGRPMGEAVECSAQVRITCRYACSQPVEWIALMRDGKLLEKHAVRNRTGKITLTDSDVGPGRHWYVACAEADSRIEGLKILAQASPYFVTVTA